MIYIFLTLSFLLVEKKRVCRIILDLPLLSRCNYLRLQRGPQLHQLRGFADIAVHSGCQTRLSITFQNGSRHGDYLWTVSRPAPAYLPCSLQSIHFRHQHIHDYDVIRLPLQGSQDLNAVACYVCPATLAY